MSKITVIISQEGISYSIGRKCLGFYKPSHRLLTTYHNKPKYAGGGSTEFVELTNINMPTNVSFYGLYKENAKKAKATYLDSTIVYLSNKYPELQIYHIDTNLSLDTSKKSMRFVKFAKEVNQGTTALTELFNRNGFEVENIPTFNITAEMQEWYSNFQKHWTNAI